MLTIADMERRLNDASDQLAKCARETSPKRDTHEKAYARAFQDLVKVGARGQLRRKYRHYTYSPGHAKG